MTQLEDWEPRGAVAPGQLVEARLLLHVAAQAVCAPGQTLLPAAADDSQASLEWLGRGLIAGRLIEAPAGAASGPRPGLRAALDPVALRLLLVDRAGITLGALDLRGRTLAEALGWLAQRIADKRGGEAPALEPPRHELPPHPVLAGAPFGAVDGRALAEVAGWFADGHRLLREVRSEVPMASPARLWPHHFDLAIQIPLDGPRGAEGRSIGIGLSPGDDSYAEPYLYVSPWPRPQPPLPALSEGSWHQQGWLGAVLLGTRIVAAGAAAAQAERASGFVQAAREACARLLARA